MQTIKFKRGDTYTLTGTYKRNNAPTDITAITLRSQIRTAAGALVTSLIATKADQTATPGKFTLSPEIADTTKWPLGEVYCDIEFNSGGTSISSDTFVIVVTEGITT